jgi:hypothetical protein
MPRHCSARPLTVLAALLGLALAFAATPAPATAATAASRPQAAIEPPAPEQAAAGWYRRAGGEQRSKHYRILSDLSPEETRLYGRHLDLMYEEYSRRMAGIPQQAPEIPFVLMFAKQADYLAVMRSTYGINATGSGGMFFITPRGAALAFFVESLPQTRVFHVIQHEGFHQYAHSRFAGRLPIWVNEGLAEFFGEAIVVDGRVIVGQASPRAVTRVKDAIDRGATVDFLRMLTMTTDQWNGNVRTGNAGIQYLQAWSMVQFLGWAEGGRYQRPFEAYLRLLHGGVPSDRAFVQAFGTADVASFERAWKAWAKEMVPSAFSVAAMRITFLAEGLALLSSEGVSVTGLDELVSELRERRFAIEVTVHGRTERIEADDGVLDIPQDALAEEKPVFDLIPAKDARRRVGPNSSDLPPPTPAVVTTRGLEPRELVLSWRRLGKKGGFEYELLSPKTAPKAPRKPKVEKDSAAP